MIPCARCKCFFLYNFLFIHREDQFFCRQFSLSPCPGVGQSLLHAIILCPCAGLCAKAGFRPAAAYPCLPAWQAKAGRQPPLLWGPQRKNEVGVKSVRLRPAALIIRFFRAYAQPSPWQLKLPTDSGIDALPDFLFIKIVKFTSEYFLAAP